MKIKTPNVEEILNRLKEFTDDDLGQYAKIVKDSFREIDPAFTKQKYSDFFCHCAATVPGWVPEVIINNAEVESQGSAKLLDLWKSTKVGKEIENSILVHARDESRHSHLFVKLVSLAFPDAYSDRKLSKVRESLTKIRGDDLVKEEDSVSDDILLDHLIQMNMGEIRTLIHMYFLGPSILSMAPRENKDKIWDITQGLERDEISHIGDTSKLIENWCGDKNFERARQLYCGRLMSFHKLTISQTEETVREYGQNKYPQLLEV